VIELTITVVLLIFGSWLMYYTYQAIRRPKTTELSQPKVAAVPITHATITNIGSDRALRHADARRVPIIIRRRPE
jgi:hypothetical protein